MKMCLRKNNQLTAFVDSSWEATDQKEQKEQV